MWGGVQVTWNGCSGLCNMLDLMKKTLYLRMVDALALLALGLFLAGCVAPPKGGAPVGNGDLSSSAMGQTVNDLSLESPPIPSDGVNGEGLPKPFVEGSVLPVAGPSSVAPPPLDAPIPTIAKTTPFLLPEEAPKQPLATYTVSMIDAPVREVLFALARDAELNVDIYPGITDKITINAVNQTLPAILDRIVEQTNLQYQIKDSVIIITQDRPFRRSYVLDYPQTKRSAKSGMNVSTQMASSSSTANSSNGSEVTLESEDSSKDFWENLVENIKNMVESSEKRGSEESATSDTEGEKSEKTDTKKKADKDSEKVVLNHATGVLSVLATNRQHKQIQSFIDRVMRVAMRQVFIEATVVSVQLSDQYQTGVDWNMLNSGSNPTKQSLLGTRMNDPPNFMLKVNRTSIPLVTGLLGIHDLTATVRMLSHFGNAKVVSTPKVTVLNNQTAILRVTTNKVYFEMKVTAPTVTISPTGVLQSVTPGTSQTFVRTVPEGFVMQVTPQIDDNNVITMNIRPTLQSISEWIDSPDPNMRTNLIDGGAAFEPPKVPIVKVQEMDSVLRVTSGQVAVMGGLMQNEHNKNLDGIPYLSKVPLVGSLFSYRQDESKKTELVIFLRPVVLNETDDLRKVANQELYQDRPFDNYWGQSGVAIQ